MAFTKDISVALGGGGSRGYAHIGVLHRLEDAGFIIRCIAGTSAGGIIACLFAAGYTPSQMESLAGKIDQNHLFSFWSNEGPSILGLSNARRILDEFLGDRTFDDLKIPCAVMAVDIKTPGEIILNKGRVVDAILATIAVPGVFPPRMVAGHELVDGAVLNPVPVSIARAMSPKLPVVAVVLSPPMEKPGRVPHLPLPVKVPSPIIERITHLRVAQALSVFVRSVDIGQRMVTELRLVLDKPEVVIRPPVDEIGILDKVDIHKLVQLGKNATEIKLQELNKSLSWAGCIKRQLFPRQTSIKKAEKM